MIPLTPNVQNRQIHRDRNEVSDCEGLEGLGWGCVLMDMGLLMKVMKCSGISVQLCKYTKIHSFIHFKKVSFMDVNFIPT